MLGENYATNTWPSCGEIDIMDLKEVTFYYLRYVTLSGNSGGNGNSGSTTVANVLNFTFTKPSGLLLVKFM
jgi:hypothetical protein